MSETQDIADASAQIEESPPVEMSEPEANPEANDAVLEDIEYEGEVYALPRKLKGALLRHADYTRKTQALAEERRTHEVSIQMQRDIEKFRQAFHHERAALLKVDEDLQKYHGVDWNTWAQREPALARQHFSAANALLRRKGEIETQTRNRIEHLRQLQQADKLRRANAAFSELKAKIPDWSADKNKMLLDFAAERGFHDHELRNVDDPRVIQILHDAYLYRQGMKTARVQPDARPAIPVVRVQGNGRISSDPSDADDPSTWLKKRYAQINRRR